MAYIRILMCVWECKILVQRVMDFLGISEIILP